MITKSLKKKEKVLLVGFGTFQVSRRKAGEGRNPQTGEKIKIPAGDRAALQGEQGAQGRASTSDAARPCCDTNARRAISSAVEHSLYTGQVGGSIPSSPTILLSALEAAGFGPSEWRARAFRQPGEVGCSSAFRTAANAPATSGVCGRYRLVASFLTRGAARLRP